jgi:hypothetical protein
MKSGQNRTASWSLWSHLQPILLAPQLWILWVPCGILWRGPRSKLIAVISAADGALPTLFGATSPEAEPMGYYGPNGFYELKGPVASAYVAPKAKDEGLARKLWEVSEKLTGVQWPVEEQSRASFLSR